MALNDYPGWDTLSLCVDCARHESLRAFIRDHAGAAERCGICLRTAPTAVVCAMADREQMTYRLRALIRYHYDEAQYNGHFGGSSPQVLLSEDNPILDAVARVSALPHWDDAQDFIGHLCASDHMPRYDEGVWLYHQNDGYIATALRRHQSNVFWRLVRALRRQNYFLLEPEVTALLKRAGTRIETPLAAGSTCYRARIGIAKRVRRDERGEIRYLAIPYQGSEISAPPAPAATPGRLNRAGVSFLYLASDEDTAAREVRPHRAHELSIVTFASNRELRLARFDIPIDDFTSNDTELDLYDFIHTLEHFMGEPVTPELTARHTVTQLVADVLRQIGFDGVVYRSSLGNGRNICVFDPETFAQVDGSARLFKVEEIVYSLAPAEFVLVPAENDYAMNV